MAEDFSSTSFQPAFFKSRPSTWHCSDTLFPTATETLGTWTFNVGNSGGQGCQKTRESRVVPTPHPAITHYSGTLSQTTPTLQLPPTRFCQSVLQTCSAATLLVPTTAAVWHVAEGSIPLVLAMQLLLAHSAQPLILPALQPEQGTGTAKWVSSQDPGGYEGHQSQGQVRERGGLVSKRRVGMQRQRGS